MPSANKLWFNTRLVDTPRLKEAYAYAGWLVGQQLFAGETTRLAYMAEEAIEGRDSFLEKRPADFSRFPWHV